MSRSAPRVVPRCAAEVATLERRLSDVQSRQAQALLIGWPRLAATYDAELEVLAGKIAQARAAAGYANRGKQ